MPVVAFLPWTTIAKPIHAGGFELVPMGVALGEGQIPSEHVPAVETILTAYGHRRPVDRHTVPLLRLADSMITADLTDEQVRDYFEFRTRLTFSVLSARRPFFLRYCNSDNVRLVIQGFTPGREGAAVLEHRRLDGTTRLLVPKGKLSVTRPHHVSGRCELPKDTDSDLLEALEAAAATRGELWGRLGEAIRLFVGANTDSPDVNMHTELIDVVSAFSRLASEWHERGTVAGFVETLPTPTRPLFRLAAPKTAHAKVEAVAADRTALRELWLKDAYVLRSQFAHGQIEASGYTSTWTDREHLLLASVAFPLYVKAVLQKEDLCNMTEEDRIMNIAFDDLLLEPFADVAEDGSSSWSDIVSEVRLRVVAERIQHEFGPA